MKLMTMEKLYRELTFANPEIALTSNDFYYKPKSYCE